MGFTVVVGTGNVDCNIHGNDDVRENGVDDDCGHTNGSVYDDDDCRDGYIKVF